MDEDELLSRVFLGKGGSAPGLAALSTSDAPPEPWLELPPGHSVYAIGVDADPGRIALGTRAGTIELLTDFQPECPEHLAHRDALEQGAAVLSICWLPDGVLTGADEAGRCLLWDLPNDPHRPLALETAGHDVVALAAGADGSPLGLSACGGLLLWDRDGYELQEVLEAPCPARPLALARLVYWPQAHAMAYAGVDGSLVLWDAEHGRVLACEAHEGPYHAVFVLDERLVTIGGTEAALWDAPGQRTTFRHHITEEIVAGWGLPLDRDAFILVGKEGGVSVHRMEDSKTRLIRSWPQQDVRTLGGCPVTCIEPLRARNREQRAGRTRDEILRRIGTGEPGDLEPLHEELEQLGYVSLSLGLRAGHLQQQDRWIEELGVRHELFSALPEGDPRSRRSVHRYIQLLRRGWRLREAAAVQLLDELDVRTADVRWLRECDQAMRSDMWVVEPGIALEELIDAADVIGQPFVGGWVREALDTSALPGLQLSAQQFVQKYERIRQDSAKGLPVASAQSLWWISEALPLRAEAVILTSDENHVDGGIEIVMRLEGTGLLTSVVPFLIFRAGRNAERSDPGQHNQRLCNALAGATRSPVLSGWLREVHRVVRHVLQRLQSEACSRWVL
jgi:hypothetical protein